MWTALSRVDKVQQPQIRFSWIQRMEGVSSMVLSLELPVKKKMRRAIRVPASSVCLSYMADIMYFSGSRD